MHQNIFLLFYSHEILRTTVHTLLSLLVVAIFYHHLVPKLDETRSGEKLRSARRVAWVSKGLPLIGNAHSFLCDPRPFFLSLSAQNPVRLRLPGLNPILVQGPENIRSLFRQSAQTNPAYAQQFICGHLFGMSKAASASFVRDDSGTAAKPRPNSCVEPRNRICYRDREIIRSMFQGRQLNKLIDTFSRLLYRRVGALPIGCEWTQMPDAFDFIATQITPVIVEMLCGPALVELIDPEFVRDFWKFHHWVPAMAKRAPRFFFPEGYKIRDKLIASIKRWRLATCSLEDGNPLKGCEEMASKFSLLDVDGWDMDAIAANDLGLLWAANSNTISTLYWMVFEIFRRPSLLASIRSECARSISTRPTDSRLNFELFALLEQPLLQSTFAETLRFRDHIVITRYPDPEDMYVNGWQLPARTLVMVCSTVQHMDKTVWYAGRNGEHPVDTFYPERFLRYQAEPTATSGLRANAAPREQDGVPDAPEAEMTAMPQPIFSTKGLDGTWIPFGGGSQMCPGQKLAKVQVFLAIALLTTQFDIELAEPSREMSVDWSHFGTGVAKPASKLPFRLRRRGLRK